MSNSGNELVMRSFVKAIEDGDRVTLSKIISPEATWTLHGTLPVAGHYVGLASILDDFLAQGLGLYAPGTLKIDLTNVISDGEAGSLEWHAVGRSVNGNVYDNEYAFFFTFSDGQILSIREYCDTLHVREALYES